MTRETLYDRSDEERGIEPLSRLDEQAASSAAPILAGVEGALRALFGGELPDIGDVLLELEVRGLLVVEAEQLRRVAGLVESVAQGRRIGLPGLAVELGEPRTGARLVAGLGGVERALEELEARAWE